MYIAQNKKSSVAYMLGMHLVPMSVCCISCYTYAMVLLFCYLYGT